MHSKLPWKKELRLSPCPLCAAISDESGTALRIAEFDESVVMLGENQGCPGWCVLVLKEHVEHLAEMPVERQTRLFGEVARVAAAVRLVVGPVRINYECLGNVVGHVHWHVVPRHADDPTPRATVWGWTPERLRGMMGVDERMVLAGRLRAALHRAE